MNSRAGARNIQDDPGAPCRARKSRSAQENTTIWVLKVYRSQMKELPMVIGGTV